MAAALPLWTMSLLSPRSSLPPPGASMASSSRMRVDWVPRATVGASGGADGELLQRDVVERHHAAAGDGDAEVVMMPDDARRDGDGA
jgi:hypothetical protein